MPELICSDTNVWIDFCVVSAIELPFRLPCTYLMWEDAVAKEILSPDGLREELLDAGLMPVEITSDEFYLADDFGDRYPRLSPFDAVALAIAKERGIVLMTGDKHLRRAAEDEGVEVTGTIGVLDRLFEEGLASEEEYRACIAALLGANGGVVRLPEGELKKRL